jgi:hypothetical protein
MEDRQTSHNKASSQVNSVLARTLYEIYATLMFRCRRRRKI